MAINDEIRRLRNDRDAHYTHALEMQKRALKAEDERMDWLSKLHQGMVVGRRFLCESSASECAKRQRHFEQRRDQEIGFAQETQAQLDLYIMGQLDFMSTEA